MLEIVALFIVLSTIVMLCLWKGDSIISPQILFTVSFIPALFLLLFYVDKWKVMLGIDVVFYLLLGPILFVSVCGVCRYIFNVTEKKCSSVKNNSIDSIKTWKLLSFTIWEVISIFVFLNFIIKTVGGYGTLSELLGAYRTLTMASVAVIKKPIILYFAFLVCYNTDGFWVIIILHFIKKGNLSDKRLWISILNYILLLIFSLLGGGRAKLIAIMITSVILSVLYIGKDKVFFHKFIKYICMCAILLISMFKQIAVTLGRKIKISFLDYIALYVSAPIVNLDWLLRNGYYNSSTGIVKNRTFVSIINDLARIIKHPEYRHSAGFPFRFTNGYNLGNVYTVYSSYLCDGGVLFLIGCIIMAAVISMFFYTKAERSVYGNPDDISIYALIYGYIGYSLLFSFFAEQIFLNTVAISYWLGIVVMLIIKKILLM